MQTVNYKESGEGKYLFGRYVSAIMSSVNMNVDNNFYNFCSDNPISKLNR